MAANICGLNRYVFFYEVSHSQCLYLHVNLINIVDIQKNWTFSGIGGAILMPCNIKYFDSRKAK